MKLACKGLERNSMLAHAKQPNNFGLPAEIVEQVKARCAELFPFYYSQVGCIEMEAKAYQKLQEK